MRVRDLNQLLADPNGEENKRKIIEFIKHRLRNRFIVPLSHVPTKFKSGFLMMASACLLIETLQCFYTGKQNTKERGAGEQAFREFFEREAKLFPGFAANSSSFYEHIRCGILHQAETTGGYRILGKGPIYDPGARAINADEFLKALDSAITNYVATLHISADHPVLWANALKKLHFICANCHA